MNVPALDIKDILEAESSLALTFATDLFVGKEPPNPNNSVTIFDTPGRRPMLGISTGNDYFFPSVQVRVRNEDYTTGWNLINDIKEKLHGRANETWNGAYYALIECVIEPSLLGWDDNDRVWFVTTFDLQRRAV
jgi:hypothetical protein